MLDSLKNYKLYEKRGFSLLESVELIQLTLIITLFNSLIKSKLSLNIYPGIPDELNRTIGFKAKLFNKLSSKWEEVNLNYALNWESYYNELLKFDIDCILLFEHQEFFDHILDFFSSQLNAYINSSIDYYRLKSDDIKYNVNMVDLALESDLNNESYASRAQYLSKVQTKYSDVLSKFKARQIQKIDFLDEKIKFLKVKISYIQISEEEQDLSDRCEILDLFNLVNSYILTAPNDYNLDFVISNEQLCKVLVTIRNYINKLVNELECLE